MTQIRLLFTGLLIYASVTYRYDRIAKKRSQHTSETSIDHEYKPDNAFETYRIPGPEPVSAPENAQTNNDFFDNAVTTSAPSNIYSPGSHHNSPFGSMTSAAGTNNYGQRQMQPNIDKSRRSSAATYSRFYHSPESDDGRSQGDGLPSAAAGQETRQSNQHPASQRSSLNNLLIPSIASILNSDYIVSRQSLNDEQAKMYWQRQRRYGATSIKSR